MKIIKAPSKIPWGTAISVFLAGTIDKGKSKDWQSWVESLLDDLNILIINPRRDAWDLSWEKNINNLEFKKQVEWELDALRQADHIFIYFAPQSQSPISLLELGLYAASNKVIIVCPQGFWRKGNIEIVAERFDIPLCESLEEGLILLKNKLLITTDINK